MTRSDASIRWTTRSRACNPTVKRLWRRVAVDTTLGHERADHADAAELGEAAQLLAGAASDGAVAGEDDGPFGVDDGLEGAVDDLVVGYGAAHALRMNRLGPCRRLGDVLRKLDVAGTGLFGDRQLERLADHFRNIVGVDQRPRPLGHRLEHADDVHVLMTLFVQALAVGLPGHDHQRGAVHVGVGDTCHQVGGSRPESTQADPRFTGQPPVDVGHECGTLLVPSEDEVDRRVLQRHHQVGILFAGNTENPRHPLCLEATHE